MIVEPDSDLGVFSFFVCFSVHILAFLMGLFDSYMEAFTTGLVKSSC